MRRIIGLILLLLIALLVGEVFLYLWFARLVGDYFWPILVIIGLGVVGVKLITSTLRQLPMAMLPGAKGAGGAGRMLVRILSGMLLVFPGLGTDALGLLLLLPGLDRLFSRLGERVLAAVIRQSMARMMGGQGGFPFPGMGANTGGFAGFPGFPGAGSPGMKPDDRRSFGPSGPGKKPLAGPKTYDTTAEKE